MRKTRTIFPCRVSLIGGCLVLAMLCATASGETRAIRFSGDCDLTAHDSFQQGIEVQAEGRMHYSGRISCHSFLRGDWIISPPISVTNPGGTTMYCRYYIAFYDKDDRLVGCCNQGARVAAGKDDLGFASCIIHGPKDRLLEATRYDAVVYESDEPIGVEAQSDDFDTPLAEAETIITKLDDIKRSATENDRYTMRQATASIERTAKTDNERNTHLSLGDGVYDMYLTTAFRETLEVTTTRAGKSELQYKAWRTNAEFERRIRDRNIRHKYHVALLDDEDRLIVCSTYTGGHDLYAPPDLLLAAKKLLLVVYEEPPRS